MEAWWFPTKVLKFGNRKHAGASHPNGMKTMWLQNGEIMYYCCRAKSQPLGWDVTQGLHNSREALWFPTRVLNVSIDSNSRPLGWVGWNATRGLYNGMKALWFPNRVIPDRSGGSGWTPPGVYAKHGTPPPPPPPLANITNTTTTNHDAPESVRRVDDPLAEQRLKLV